jgi:hypothetical protein
LLATRKAQPIIVSVILLISSETGAISYPCLSVIICGYIYLA